MAPEQRFSLLLVRLMLTENREIYSTEHEEVVGHLAVGNCPGNRHWTFVSISPGGRITTVVDRDLAEEDDWTIGWPRTAHERLEIVARIDSALATGVWIGALP